MTLPEGLPPYNLETSETYGVGVFQTIVEFIEIPEGAKAERLDYGQETDEIRND